MFFFINLIKAGFRRRVTCGAIHTHTHTTTTISIMNEKQFYFILLSAFFIIYWDFRDFPHNINEKRSRAKTMKINYRNDYVEHYRWRIKRIIQEIFVWMQIYAVLHQTKWRDKRKIYMTKIGLKDGTTDQETKEEKKNWLWERSGTLTLLIKLCAY